MSKLCIGGVDVNAFIIEQNLRPMRGGYTRDAFLALHPDITKATTEIILVDEARLVVAALYSNGRFEEEHRTIDGDEAFTVSLFGVTPWPINAPILDGLALVARGSSQNYCDDTNDHQEFIDLSSQAESWEVRIIPHMDAF